MRQNLVLKLLLIGYEKIFKAKNEKKKKRTG